MQPGTVPGCILELHAAKANGGASPGVNSPLTTTWFDTSGNGNHGTLQTFAGTEASGYAGTGTLADPHRLVGDGATDRLDLPDLGATEDKTFTLECWAEMPAAPVGSGVYQFMFSETGPAGSVTTPHVGLCLYSTTGRARMYYRASDNTTASCYSLASVCDGGLHHIVGVSDGVVASVFADVQQGVEANVPSGPIAMNALKAFCSGQQQYYWPRSILVARIYPFALTPAQVAANFAAGYLWPSTALASHHYRLRRSA